MPHEDPPQTCAASDLRGFVRVVRQEGQRHYRDLPWRNTRDPYLILCSEVMLQQTQVARVLAYWPRWLAAFPTVDALAAASTADVLALWQGLGYNRRALALKKAAEICAAEHAGCVPGSLTQLRALPGVGPATAAGVCVFAYQQPQVYLETNVRTVFIHHFFNDKTKVSDAEIIPLAEESCCKEDPRSWYYALLDYGSYLKSVMPNPSRRSATHVRQSTFEGSLRQKRAFLLRQVLEGVGGLSGQELAEALAAFELAAGRAAVPPAAVEQLLLDLARGGFITQTPLGLWEIAD